MTIALVHRPLFIGTLDRESGRVTYRVIFACGRDTFPGDVLSTEADAVTCETCGVMLPDPAVSTKSLPTPR